MPMPPRHDSFRVVFIIILVFWVLSSPDNGSSLVAGPSLARARLARQHHALEVLQNSSWGQFHPQLPALLEEKDTNETEIRNATDTTIGGPGFLNLTGFRAVDGFAWADVGRFRNRCEEWNRYAVGSPEAALPIWKNVTGVVRGPWVRKNASVSRFHADYNLTTMTPTVDWSSTSSEWNRNITGSRGTMMIRFEDMEGAETEPKELHPNTGALLEVKAREMSTTVTIDDDEGSGSSFDIRLHGVHWPQRGAMLLTTTSEKFAGVFGLPHLAEGPEFFNVSQSLLNRTLTKALAEKEKNIFTDAVSPWTSDLDGAGESFKPSPQCEFVLYAQVQPPSGARLRVQPEVPNSKQEMTGLIADMETELRFPKGAPVSTYPKLQASAILYSPDCAFFLESKGPPDYAAVDGEHLQGWKQEIWLHSVSSWLLIFAAVTMTQLQLLKNQMNESSTPSTMGRISFYTASVMLLADGITFAGSTSWSLSASATMFPSLLIACTSFLSMSVGALFLSEIYKVQESEWTRIDRDRHPVSATTISRPPSTPGNSNNAAASSTVSNTLPTVSPRHTNPRPSTPPIIIPSDQDIDAEINSILPAPVTAPSPTGQPPENTHTSLNSIFGRFIMLGIAFFFLTLAAASWRPRIRGLYFNFVAFLYLSVWVPQIYRNAYRNCRRALSWRFVVGQSILRLLPIGYFWIVQDNFAFTTPDRASFALLAAWVWVQFCVLVVQNVVGPRFAVPKGWMPDAWEYHPVLREDGIEAGGLPIGLVLESNSPSSSALSSPVEKSSHMTDRVRSGGGGGPPGSNSTRVHSIDCAICREVLQVPVIKSGASDDAGVAGVLARRVYMVTPCRHVFHSGCLESWMRYRLQCPICREELPPL